MMKVIIDRMDVVLNNPEVYVTLPPAKRSEIQDFWMLVLDGRSYFFMGDPRLAISDYDSERQLRETARRTREGRIFRGQSFKNLVVYYYEKSAEVFFREDNKLVVREETSRWADERVPSIFLPESVTDTAVQALRYRIAGWEEETIRI